MDFWKGDVRQFSRVTCRSLSALAVLYILVGILIYFSPSYGTNHGIPKSLDLGNPGIFRIKISNKNVDLTPFDIAIYVGPTNYRGRCLSMQSSIHHFVLLLDYMDYCCATSVFGNVNPKTNGTLNKLRL